MKFGQNKLEKIIITHVQKMTFLLPKSHNFAVAKVKNDKIKR
jgi:hypothetical protein